MLGVCFACLIMIHVMRDGQQFGPYTLEDLNAYLAQGSLLPTDQAWWEGAPAWVPMDQVPGVQLPGMPPVAQAPTQVAADPMGVANPEVAAVQAEAITGGAPEAAKKKKIIIIAGLVLGVVAIAGVLLFVWPGFLKEDGGGELPTSPPPSQAGGNGGAGQTFAEVVKPIFEKNTCYDCHDGVEDPENKKNKAFNLAKNDSIKEDIEVGNADASELILRLTDKEDPMPPKGDMLSQEDVQKIKDWINAGAKF